MNFANLRWVLASLATSALIQPVSANEVTTYTYDAQGRLIKTAKNGGPVSGQEKCTDYDPAGNRSARTISTSGCEPATGGGGGGGGGGTSPSFTINDPPGTLEGQSIVFTVTKTGDGAASVNYATANGSASGSDYVAKSGTLSFASGDTTKTITVVTYADSLNEGTETFIVNISGATGGATISDPQGTGTIINDDAGSCSPTCQ